MNIHRFAMKAILLTGATDGIGYEVAKLLVTQGHHLLIHGRNPAKVEKTAAKLRVVNQNSRVDTVVADLSRMSEVDKMAKEVHKKCDKLDVLINNAGVFKTPVQRTEDGLDIRFAVNTIAPYLLTKRLLPIIQKYGRIVNLSSAAQFPVGLNSMAGEGGQLDDNSAYAQSKLAITMWSYALSFEHPQMIVAINPASFLGSKMVKEAYGVPGKDLSIGAEIVRDAALSKKFERASGKYFNNDRGQFESPHPDGTNKQKCDELVSRMDEILVGLGYS